MGEFARSKRGKVVVGVVVLVAIVIALVLAFTGGNGNAKPGASAGSSGSGTSASSGASGGSSGSANGPTYATGATGDCLSTTFGGDSVAVHGPGYGSFEMSLHATSEIEVEGEDNDGATLYYFADPSKAAAAIPELKTIEKGAAPSQPNGGNVILDGGLSASDQSSVMSCLQ